MKDRKVLIIYWSIHEYPRISGKGTFKKFQIKTLKGKVASLSMMPFVRLKRLAEVFGLLKLKFTLVVEEKLVALKLATSLDQVKEHASEILGKTLVTHQTA